VAPTAKRLILELLAAAGGGPLSVRVAVAAGALFEISENNVRVALVRLSTQGLIEAAGRGEYSLTDDAHPLASEVASWRDAEERVCRWNGEYIAVHTGALGRTDKRALRQRTRAFSIVGLAEAERGLHLRPDNLKGSVEGVRTRLQALGLAPSLTVFRASSFSPELEERIHGLWDGKRLTESYVRSRRAIERWLSRAARLEPDVAARESFLLGSQTIRQLVYDPLLPPPLVDVDERRAFVQALKQLDREGRQIWQRFYEFTELSNGAAAAVH
jgi:phenylacetic acid degradation operon negative regulatory protein